MKSEGSVQKRLEHLIITGVYSGGDRLPAERELAGQLETSRNSVREAIARLTALGMLTTLPQSGSYVVNYQDNGSIDLFSHLFNEHGRFDDNIVQGLLDLRTLMETAAVGQAAEHPDHEDIAAGLSSLTQKLETAGKDACLEFDLIYHTELITYSSNPVYKTIFVSMKGLYRNVAESAYSVPAQKEELLWLQKRVNQAVSEGNSLLSQRSLHQLLKSMTEIFFC